MFGKNADSEKSQSQSQPQAQPPPHGPPQQGGALENSPLKHTADILRESVNVLKEGDVEGPGKTDSIVYKEDKNSK